MSPHAEEKKEKDHTEGQHHQQVEATDQDPDGRDRDEDSGHEEEHGSTSSSKKKSDHGGATSKSSHHHHHHDQHHHPTSPVATKPNKPSSSSSGLSSKSPSGNSGSSKPRSLTNVTGSGSGSGGASKPAPSNSSSAIKSPKTPRTRSSVSTSSASSRRRKKRLTFKKTVGVHSIPNIETYTNEEKELTWYMPDEYGQMEDECDMTAEMLDCRKPLWPGFCARGLEAWTTEGEQRKEGHVQLAIDIVWQAQLEQWKASSDIHECWEFIRKRYMQVSKPCQKLAHKRGLADEHEVQSYLAGVKSVEKNRLRMLRIHKKDAAAKDPRKVRRSTSEYATPTGSITTKKKIGRTSSESSTTKSPPNRSNSEPFASPPKLKGLLKISLEEDEEDNSKRNRKPSSNASVSSKKKSSNTDDEDGADTIISTDSKGSKKRISYQPKSRSKVPVSPVGSLVSAATGDDDSVSRRLRSHMSVCSDDSTRRRMLRTTKVPL